MTAPSPAFTINGTAAALGAVAVPDQQNVALALVSTTGVRTVTWAVQSVDELTGDPTDVGLTPSGALGENCTVALSELVPGFAAIISCTINGGIDSATGQPPANTSSVTATGKLYVPTIRGWQVGASGETFEANPTYGSTGVLNTPARPLTWGNISTTDATPVTVASWSIPTNSVALLRGYIAAKKSDNTIGGIYSVQAGVRNNAGACALVGAATVAAYEDDAAWDATIDVSGTSARLRFTGKAATTIAGYGWIEMMARYPVV